MKAIIGRKVIEMNKAEEKQQAPTAPQSLRNWQICVRSSPTSAS